MNELEIRQCLEVLEIDASLIEQFLDLLTLVRDKACNGHKMAGLRLQELLSEAVFIGSENIIDFSQCSTTQKTDALHQVLEDQITKTRESLERLNLKKKKL